MSVTSSLQICMLEILLIKSSSRFIVPSIYSFPAWGQRKLWLFLKYMMLTAKIYWLVLTPVQHILVFSITTPKHSKIELTNKSRFPIYLRKSLSITKYRIDILEIWIEVKLSRIISVPYRNLIRSMKNLMICYLLIASSNLYTVDLLRKNWMNSYLIDWIIYPFLEQCDLMTPLIIGLIIHSTST